MTAIYDPSIDNHRFAAPNKFYESLMLGKPVIMVRNTGMSTVVEENGIGAVIDYSVEGLYEGLQYLIEKRDKWESMSQRMKAIYQEKYSWDEMEMRLLNLYETLFN